MVCHLFMETYGGRLFFMPNPFSLQYVEIGKFNAVNCSNESRKCRRPVFVGFFDPWLRLDMSFQKRCRGNFTAVLGTGQIVWRTILCPVSKN